MVLPHLLADSVEEFCTQVLDPRVALVREFDALGGFLLRELLHNE